MFKDAETYKIKRMETANNILASSYVPEETKANMGFWEMSNSDRKKGWRILNEKIKDDPISRDEFNTRTKSLGELCHTVSPNKAYVKSKYITPLTVEMKSELLTKAWIMTPTEPILERHIPKHKKQIMEPDNYKIDYKVDMYRRLPVEHRDPFRSMHSDVFGEEESAEDKKLYRNRDFERLGRENVERIIQNSKWMREQDDVKQEIVYKQGFRKLYEKELISISQEVDDWSWCPAGQKEKPVWKDGGYHFKEWEKEMKELLQEYVNSDERV